MHGSENSIRNASTWTSGLSFMQFFISFRSWNDDLQLGRYSFCEPIVIGFSNFCEAQHHTAAHQTVGNYLHFLNLALSSITKQWMWSCLSVDHWCKMKASPRPFLFLFILKQGVGQPDKFIRRFKRAEIFVCVGLAIWLLSTDVVLFRINGECCFIANEMMVTGECPGTLAYSMMNMCFSCFWMTMTSTSLLIASNLKPRNFVE